MNSDPNKPNFVYSKNIQTKITEEIPRKDNPYICQTQRIHGYDLKELITHKSFIEVTFLLLTGELPTSEQKQLLDNLAASLSNLGPRHQATRSAMIAGASKTRTSQILPISLLSLSGTDESASEVESAIAFFEKNQAYASQDVAIELCKGYEAKHGDCNLAPGYSNYYGQPDNFVIDLARQLLEQNPGSFCLKWAIELSDKVEPVSMGLNRAGMAGAMFYDLRIPPRQAGCLFQILVAPGIIAHGVEQTHKPITSFPFIKDEDYTYEER